MLEDDIHTFALGDVHERADLLWQLLEEIRCKAETKRFKYRVVFLGDIIDRGSDSRGAMDLVIETLRDVPGSELILGNHESLLLRVIDEGDSRFYNWFSQGGMETLTSYGHPIGVEANPDTARQLIPNEHIETMRAAKHYVELPDHVLVHAGIRPGIPLEQQDPYDLMWIRAGFLEHMRPFRKMVVHGHSPTRSKLVEQWPGRIAVDTKAYGDGRLSTLHIPPSGGLSVIYASGCAKGRLTTTTESVPTCMDLDASTARAGRAMICSTGRPPRGEGRRCCAPNLARDLDSSYDSRNVEGWSSPHCDPVHIGSIRVISDLELKSSLTWMRRLASDALAKQ